MYKHFSLREFECKCGCGKNDVQAVLIEMLDKARELAEVPFVVTSGCRCENHNREIGGSEKSGHISGEAADIAVNSRTRYAVLKGIIKAGFKRIGVSKDFIHVDIKQEPGCLWVY